MKARTPRTVSKAKAERRPIGAKKHGNLVVASGPVKRKRPVPLRANDLKDEHLELLNAAFK